MTGTLARNSRAIIRFAAIAASAAVMALNGPASYALSQEQVDALSEGIHYFNTEVSTCLGGSGTSSVDVASLPATIPQAWRDVLSQAASAKDTSVSLLAALVMDEQGNVWHDFNYKWSTSSSGAEGPFQFLPLTWESHKQDGNKDGVADVQNVWDAAYAAADLLHALGARPDTPLGTIDQPMARNTLLYFAFGYNQGGHAAEVTSPTVTIDELAKLKPPAGVPTLDYPQGANYVSNTYAVLSSGFTKKGGTYASDPQSQMGGTTTGTTAATRAPAAAPNCSCATTASASAGNGTQPVIVVDPGHSGQATDVIDPTTQLDQQESTNSPEKEDVFDVAKLVEAKLTTDGYKVLLTKSSANDTKTFRERADLASNSHAALAISIHDQAGPPNGGSGGLPFKSANNHVYVQKLDHYRVNINGKKILFTNAAVAQLSAQYGDIFTAERTAAEGHTVDLDDPHGLGGRGLAAGNIWMVQLLTNVPWIYNEVGGVSSSGTIAHKYGLSNEDKQKYANGLIAGVERSVPVHGGTSTCSNNTIKSKALELAFDDKSHGPLKLDSKPEYLSARESTPGVKIYTADTTDDRSYSDCGLFVATVMRASGVDPDYTARNTVDQIKYLEDQSKSPSGKYEQIVTTNTGDLHPGDIFIFATYYGGPGHTYIYTGPGHGDIARSASFFGHVPEATGVNFTQKDKDGKTYTFSIFRFKGLNP